MMEMRRYHGVDEVVFDRGVPNGRPGLMSFAAARCK